MDVFTPISPGERASLFLLSAATLIFEINLTRLFSVAQFYHFAFLVVSLALLGFGAWCADEYEDGWYFAVKWALDLRTLAAMDHETLAGVLGAMADEVAEFNAMFEEDEED